MGNKTIRSGVRAAMAALSLSAAGANAAETLLSQNKPSQASSIHPVGYPTTFGPANAFDGIIDTENRYCSADNPSAKAVTLDVDLGAVYSLSRAVVNTGKWGLYPMPSFELQAKKAAGDAYVAISGASVTGNTQIARAIAFGAGAQGRYVRLVCRTGDSLDGLCRVRELQIYGSTVAATPSPSPSPTTPPANNMLPKVGAGNDQSIALPTSSVSLAGSATDLDGKIVSQAWTKVSGPGTQTFSAPSALSTSVSGLSTAGTYVFRLTAKDDDGASASDDVQVTVLAASGPADPLPSIPTMEGLPAPAPQPGKLQVWTRNVPGVYPAHNNYNAVVFLPADYNANPTKKYPLIISLYGVGGRTLSTDQTQLYSPLEGFVLQLANGTALQSSFQGIVIAPDGHAPGQGGQVWWNVDMNARLIADAMKYYRVDSKRVVATGLSAGGGGTDDLMVKYKTLLAGAAPVAYFPPNNNAMTAANTCPFVGFPIWAAGNECDGTFGKYNWTYQFQATLQQCPGYNPAKLTITAVSPSCAHGGWNEFYSRSDVQQWLINQSK